MRLAPRAAHVRQRRQDREERPPEVRRHRLLEVVDGHVLERPDLDDAGVVDEHVDAAPVVDDASDRALDLVAIGDVAGDRRDLAALPLDVGRGTLELLLVAGGEHHVRPGARELARHRQAEAARAAEDHDGLAGELDGAPRAQRPGRDQRAERGSDGDAERSLQPHPHTSTSAAARGRARIPGSVPQVAAPCR